MILNIDILLSFCVLDLTGQIRPGLEYCSTPPQARTIGCIMGLDLVVAIEGGGSGNGS